MARKVWNTRRRLLGNLLPIAGSLPFGVWGVWLLLQSGHIIGPELWIIGLMPAVGWLLMNLFGLFENGAMRMEIARKHGFGPPREPPERYFVGFARPTYRGLLDPHEDVGFLVLHDDSLEFLGDGEQVSLRRPDILGIRFRMNPHSWVGLGRWVSIEGKIEGKPIRMLIEPRERQTLLGNLLLSGRLRGRLEEWLSKKPEPKDEGPRNEPGPLDGALPSSSRDSTD